MGRRKYRNVTKITASQMRDRLVNDSVVPNAAPLQMRRRIMGDDGGGGMGSGCGWLR